jgi:hypothetical protein
MLRDTNNYLDLRGPAKIRLRTRTRSLHQIRLIVKLADGTMLAADYVEPESSYWRETEFYLPTFPAGARWMKRGCLYRGIPHGNLMWT